MPDKNVNIRKQICIGGPALAYAALIFFLSSISRYPEGLPSFFGLDKIVHFIEYFFFGVLYYRWISSSDRFFTRGRVLAVTVFIGVLYALTDEWHQSFVPGRNASLWDWLFDSLGVLAASITYPNLWRGGRNK
jgi:VanZ family protein